MDSSDHDSVEEEFVDVTVGYDNEWSRYDDDDESPPPLPNLDERVSCIIAADDCANNCVASKRDDLKKAVASFARMSTRDKNVSLMTLLATLPHFISVGSTAKRARTCDNARERFRFHLPYVGEVCRATFARTYGVSIRKIARMRHRVNQGFVYQAEHGNTDNQNAVTINVSRLVDWYRAFAHKSGDCVPVRMRVQTTENGITRRTTTTANHTMLPSYLTWHTLRNELSTSWKLEDANVVEPDVIPSETSLRKLLQRLCPEIQIRSSQDHVCDTCSIYANLLRNRHMGGNDPSIFGSTFELVAEHTERAKAMGYVWCPFVERVKFFDGITARRSEYKQDCDAANDKYIVLTIDYAQTVHLPHVAETPPQWFDLSLWSVSVFGIHNAYAHRQENYVYSERKGGKGPNEVVSMLMSYLEDHDLTKMSDKELIVYADNCGGQNKNNFVIKFLVMLTHIGYFQSVQLKFFVRGHTKNACDRGFGHLKRKLRRNDCWTLDELCTLIESASSDTDVVLYEKDGMFWNFKSVLNELYKNVPAIHQYQVFTVRKDEPGVVQCRESADAKAEPFDLRRVFEEVPVTSDRATQLLEGVEELPTPPLNAEKVCDIFKTIQSCRRAAYTTSEC